MTTKKILLVGDSILDNSFWPDTTAGGVPVGRGCTGDVLSAMCKVNSIKVYNHAVEETQANDWFALGHINMKASKAPAHHYFKAARKRGVKTSYKGLSINKPVSFFPVLRCETFHGLTVVVSCIGNDLFLNGEWMRLLFNATSLVRRLDEIFKAYHRAYPGCRVLYVFPYRPASIFKIPTTHLVGALLDYKINAMRTSLRALTSLDGMIDLTEHFVYLKHFADPGTGIPEPTKAGAHKLARLIYNACV